MEHVQRRGGRYFWRSRVPTDLISVLGRREITRTLHTSDPKAARYCVAEYHAIVIQAYEEARKAMAEGKAAEGVAAMVSRALATLEAAQSAARAAGGPRRPMLATIADTERDEAAEEIRAALPSLVAAIETAESQASQTARTIAAAQAIEPSTLAQLQTLLHGLGARVRTQPTPTAISFLEDEYSKEKRLDEKKDNRHILGYVRLFVKILGDRPLADYKRQDIFKWVNTLEKIKRSYGKSSMDKFGTIKEILKDSRGKETLNATTIEKHITHVKAFFLAAHRHH